MHRTDYNGILNVLKPPGMTSFDVVAFLRRLLDTGRIGHTGTLDPGAAGVLPVCLGNATKAIEYLVEKDKQYRAEITLGVSTDTQDSFGAVLGLVEPELKKEELEKALESFTGDLEQLPPMYSSVRVNGVKLYELARKGQIIERTPRAIKIHKIELLSFNYGLFEHEGKNHRCIKALLNIHCSKGTYIRTLCSDIGDKMGCGAIMSFLVRMKAGSFEMANALTLEEIARLSSAGTLYQNLIDADKAFPDMKSVALNTRDLKRLLNGIQIYLDIELRDGERVRIYDEEGKFTAFGTTAIIDNKTGIKAVKQFYKG